MTPALIAMLCATIVGTSFLSGVFGMAGGLVLVGVLLALLPLPAAMALHAVTQIASNLWRGLLWRRHVCWAAAWPYVVGSLVALGAWSLTRYVPGKPAALLMLGVTPFLVRLLPPGLKPDPERLPQGLLYGSASMTLLLLTGVSGPLVDTFFLVASWTGARSWRPRQCARCSATERSWRTSAASLTGRPGSIPPWPRWPSRPPCWAHLGAAAAGSHDGRAVPSLGQPSDHGGRALLRGARDIPARRALGARRRCHRVGASSRRILAMAAPPL